MASRKEIIEDQQFAKWFVCAMTADDDGLQSIYHIYLSGVTAGQMRLINAMHLASESEDA